jgi:hypothetical protein
MGKKRRVNKMGATASKIVYFNQLENQKNSKEIKNKKNDNNQYEKSWKELSPENIRELNSLVNMDEDDK